MGNPLKIEFLNEPFYRWVVFIIALLLALKAWNSILREMA